MGRFDYFIFTALLSVASVASMSHNMTTTMAPMQPLNCTNIPEVPMKPYDGNITAVLALANDNIRVCNLIIPLLNGFNAKLKLTGVYDQLDQVMMLMKYLQMRIEIINRRLDCGLPMSVEEARSLKQMMYNDQVSKRVLYGVKMRLTVIKERLRNIYKN
ncbi:uncharacterized protein LOC130638021 [Hydractinia symbiolongicarpus]|uniref:uncharacterized protein LOC130638021 n=1 Tax=Hydractinia symbiolongicarpus TaxID=13093 RepID=UPI0025510754|nr:uncharacterized protein LOC130638021 [Hydractinia symbiolongicarpus]